MRKMQKQIEVEVDKDCPIAKASELVGNMWTLLIVRELLSGDKRFTEIQKALVPAGEKVSINSRTLSLRLKDLEKGGIIERIVIPHEMPPHVEYKLTKQGQDLSKIVDDLKKFGKKYL